MKYRARNLAWPFAGCVLAATACGSDGPTAGGPGEVTPSNGAVEAAQAEASRRASLRAAYVQAVQRSAPEEYAVERAGEALVARNPSQGLRAELAADEARVAPLDEGEAGWSWSVGATRWGCAGELSAVGAAAPEASDNRVEYRRAGLTEWYVNGPLGVEQGFTVPEAPACRRAGGEALVIELGAAEGLTASLSREGREAVLADASGEAVLRYTDLYVSDAEGKALPARLELAEGRVSIRVDDAGAVYPVVVDPLVATPLQQLIVDDGGTGDRFGNSLAITQDTAFVGAPYSDVNGSNSGSVYVFVRSGDSWSLDKKLLAPDGASGDLFGGSLSASGDTLIVGAQYNVNAGVATGAAYVFVQSGSSWDLEAKLVADDGTASDRFGASVAISGDGAIVGAPGDESAYMFTRSGSTWTSQKLNPSSPVYYNDNVVANVAISGDKAAIKGDFETWIFTRSVSSTTWVEQQKLHTSRSWGERGVAITDDTLVIGAIHEKVNDIYTGGAHVYTRSGSTWSLSTTLFANDAEALSDFGYDVAISISGDRIVVGARNDDDNGTDSGSAYVFAYSGSAWTQLPKLLASNGTSNDSFGSAFAVSGNTLLVGAPSKPSNGAVYVYSLGQSDGDACTSNDQCVSGSCVDGVCCNEACTGLCFACSAAKTGSANGTCGPILAGADPDDECAADPESSCGNTGFCDGAGACQRYGSDTVCAAASCSGSTLTPAWTCDGGGTCVSNGTQTCGDYLCAGDACASACAGDAQCVPTAYCSGSSCVPKAPLGAPCSATNQCQSGFCVDGVCCDSACGGGATDDCQACNGAGAPPGFCAPATPATVCRLSAGACDAPEFCDGVSPACPPDAYAPPGVVCNPPLGECDAAEACTGASPLCPADAQAPDGAPCTGGTCSAGVCEQAPVQSVTPWQVATGGNHALALDWNFNVWSWGQNTSGQLGIGATSPSTAPAPVLVALSDVVAIAAGGSHSMAVDMSGALFTWGANAYGQLGVPGGSTSAPTPALSDVQAIAAGGSHSMALDWGGTIWTWGFNSSGQLGQGSFSPTSSNVPTPVTLPGGVGLAQAIAAGTNHSMALDYDGVVWTWGRDAYGQLGDGGSSTNSAVPVPVTLPLPAMAIAAGGDHSLAVLVDGSVWAWGRNSYGQLGNATAGSVAQSPVQVVGLPDAMMAIPERIVAGGNHSMVALSNGEIWTFGYDYYGQLGNGPGGGYSAAPVHVASLTDAALEPGSIAAGGNLSLAVTMAAGGNAAWSWGQDSYGQLGDGSPNANQHAPVQPLFP